ncbi:TetR/AcrR family transcriptional regulator [Kitasatospora sp. NPDC086791]|uniref:TetR/AcrR family transcriptional regulator n=1 Tax=Kitasatospora sp. NPDC086791 TaxID=3155178 RepID=UPI0034484585
MSSTPAATPGATEPPTRRSRYHHGDLANTLATEATALARQGGPTAVVLREAARRAGVSPTAAYRHFASHEDLLVAVRARAQEQLAGAMEQALRSLPVLPDPRADILRRTRVIARAYVRFAVDEPGLFRTAFSNSDPARTRARAAAAVSPPGSAGGTAGGTDIYEYRSFHILGELLDELVATGVVAPERREGAEFPAWSTMHGLATLIIDGPLAVLTPEQQELAVRVTLDTVLAGLAR